MIEVALTTTTLVAATPPTVTLLAPVKFVPVIVKAVPPNVVPNVGAMLMMVGSGTTYVNALGKVAVPPAVVTATLCAPAVPGGVDAVIEVALTTTTLVAATPPTVTLLAPVKFVPVIVKAVPPNVVPNAGAMLAMVGADEAIYVNAPVLVTGPLTVFTKTSFKPAVPAGVTAIICDSNLLVMLANEPPTSTLVAPSKLVPVIVIVVAPVVGPVTGLTSEMVGVGTTYVNAPVLVTDPPPGVVTTTSFKPALASAVLAVICVPAPLTTALTTATPPTVIVELVAPVKFVPMIVIAVPPLVGPVAGLTLVMVGIAA